MYRAPGKKRTHALEVFATDVSNLFVTDSFLGYATAVKARIVLKKPHPVFGFVNGKAAYGIRRVRLSREICRVRLKSIDWKLALQG